MIPARTAIFVATESSELRRSFDGLAGISKEILRQDPLSGASFMFFNKGADKMKIIRWDRSSYCVFYKRLERGTFRIPKVLEPSAPSHLYSRGHYGLGRRKARITADLQIPSSRALVVFEALRSPGPENVAP